MDTRTYNFGMIGLGTMGSNLVLNMSDNGFSVAVYDKQPEKIKNLQKEAKEGMVYAAADLSDFLQALATPRNIILLVPAGAPVDSVIDELTPHLGKNDLLIDLGNSHYTDTDRRLAKLQQQGLHFMGMGISGGETGARYGASIMPGGNKDTYERIAPMLKAVAAKAGGEPCVAYMGAGSAGHYVKMVHNGIEYGLMQLIAESYDLLKNVGGLDNEALHLAFSKWNKGQAKSFLLEITAEVVNRKDDLTSAYLIDVILDRAGQKGTGGWTSESALELGVPISVIDAAVTARTISSLKEQREAANAKLTRTVTKPYTNTQSLTNDLEQALQFASIISYSQGLSLLKSAGAAYNYGLNIAEIASIWRAGCIIRAAMLENIKTAYLKQQEPELLITDDYFATQLSNLQQATRRVLVAGIENGIPLPAFTAALAYYDSFSNTNLPANLIQGMRDYFGAHTYKRTDREGVFHTQWTTKHN